MKTIQEQPGCVWEWAGFDHHFSLDWILCAIKQPFFKLKNVTGFLNKKLWIWVHYSVQQHLKIENIFKISSLYQKKTWSIECNQ